MTAAPYRTIEAVGISQIRRNLKAIMLSWWPWVVGIALILRIGIAIYDAFDASVWAAAVSVSPVFLSVIGVMAGGVVMPYYIANGISRTHFATAAMAMILVTALLTAVITMVGFGVEEIVYSLAGIHHVLSEPVVYDSISQSMAVFASYFLLNAAYMTCGWTAGLGFYRWSWVGGALFLPVAILPVPLVEWLVGSDWAWNPASVVGPARVYLSLPGRFAGDIEIPVLVAVILSSLALACGLMINRLMMRNISIS